MASLPRSPVRMRTASSTGMMNIFPSPMRPGLRALLDRVEHVVDDLVGHDDLDLHFRHEVDDVRRPSVDLFLAARAPEAFDFGDGHSLHAHLGESVLHLVELEWLDDGFNLLHASSRARAGRWKRVASAPASRIGNGALAVVTIPKVSRVFRTAYRFRVTRAQVRPPLIRAANAAATLQLGRYPTPVDARRRPVGVPGGDLWVKRDDLTHDVYGGNKVRKLEHLLARSARAAGATRIVTVGAAGSHHVLATTYFGTSDGLRGRGGPRAPAADAARRRGAAGELGAGLAPVPRQLVVGGAARARAPRGRGGRLPDPVGRLERRGIDGIRRRGARARRAGRGRRAAGARRVRRRARVGGNGRGARRGLRSRGPEDAGGGRVRLEPPVGPSLRLAMRLAEQCARRAGVAAGRASSRAMRARLRVRRAVPRRGLRLRRPRGGRRGGHRAGSGRVSLSILPTPPRRSLRRCGTYVPDKRGTFSTGTRSRARPWAPCSRAGTRTGT